jgi:hypothetical protein
MGFYGTSSPLSFCLCCQLGENRAANATLLSLVPAALKWTAVLGAWSCCRWRGRGLPSRWCPFQERRSCCRWCVVQQVLSLSGAAGAGVEEGCPAGAVPALKMCACCPWVSCWPKGACSCCPWRLPCGDGVLLSSSSSFSIPCCCPCCYPSRA